MRSLPKALRGYEATGLGRTDGSAGPGAAIAAQHCAQRDRGVRASLLAGKLTRGQSAAEKQDFASHPDLLAACRPGHPPLLFHKGELVDASAAGVSVAVRQAIRETQHKVVGMVLNAVDDHLTRADQLRLSWTVSQFHHLDDPYSPKRNWCRVPWC